MSRFADRPMRLLGLMAAVLPSVGAAAEPAATAEVELEEMVVTGTRIRRAQEESANPVLSVDAGVIRQSGVNNLTDLLAQTPALLASRSSYDNAGATAPVGFAGLNLLDLRNLGYDRTLVLVNGRRHVGGIPGSAAVDINSVPVDLIERIDVLTGGASAIYGADGVSGVVNFITRRDFEGLSIRGQKGVSEEGDADNDFVSLTAGHNFGAGRGNVALGYEYNADKAVREFDRASTGDPLRAWSLKRNPDDHPDDPAIFDEIVLNDLRYADSSRDGAYDVDWDFVPDFTGSGLPYDLGIWLPESGGFVQGGSSTPQAGYSGYLLPKIRRHSVNLLGSYELAPAVRLFAEGKYVNARTWNVGQPTFDFYAFVNADNPYMPDVIRDALVPGAAGDYGLPDGIQVTRDNFDLGIRGDDVRRETLRTVLGADGTLRDGMRYELSYTFGQTRIRNLDTNQRIDERFFAALDAVDEGEFLTGTANGNIVCRIDLQPAGTVINQENIDWESFFPGGDGSGTPQTFTPGADSGCVPVNLFGENVLDPAAVAFINADPVTRSKVTQHVISASLSGELPALGLPAGAPAWAAGVEYREEKSRSTPDALIQQQLLWSYPLIETETGRFDVKEAFAEVNVPLLANAPLAHSLSVGAALRLSDYSTIGSTTAWKVDARWSPVRDLALRGTWSEAVRAPNITELYAPTGGTFEEIDDPCDPIYVVNGTQFRAANCEAVLNALGIDPDTFSPSTDPEANTSLPGSIGGNALLTEETARSWTAGFVLRPAALPEFALSLDWYDIHLKNAIATAAAQDVVDLCVDQPSLDNAYCDAISRDTDTGFIDDFYVGPQNVAAFTAAGADLSIAWAFGFDPAFGRFHWKLTGGYLDELTFVATPGAEVSDERMAVWAPKYAASTDLTWTRQGLMVNYGVNYFSKTRRYSEAEKNANPDIADSRYFYYGAKWVHDVHASFTLPGTGIALYGGINNLYDRKPARPDSSYPVSFVGRYFYGGVSLDLGTRD